MRRACAAAAAAGVVLAGLLGIRPARAGAPDVTVTAPGAGETVGTATPTVAGRVSATAVGGRVTGSLELDVASAAGHPGWSLVLSDWCGRFSCTFSVPVSPGLQWNGAYSLSVEAEETDATGGARPATYQTAFSVAAPPAAPEGLAATPSADGSSVTLSWSEPSYPDLVGYQVTRTPSGGGFPASVSGPGFVDHSVAPGNQYSYQVTAQRQGATGGSPVSSDPAGTSASIPPPAGDTSPGSGGPSGPGSGAPGPAGSGAGAAPDAGPGAGRAPVTGSAVSGPAPAGGPATAGAAPRRGEPAAAPPARVAPGAPAVPGDGVAPGSDNPAVAPFGGAAPEAAGPGHSGVTITYESPAVHATEVRDYAALGLAALVLAVAAHLLWWRRELRPAP